MKLRQSQQGKSGSSALAYTHAWGSWPISQSSKPLLTCCQVNASNGHPCLIWMLCQVSVGSVLPICTLFGNVSLCPSVELLWAKCSRAGTQCQKRTHMLKQSWENDQSCKHFQSSPSSLYLGVSKHMCALYKCNLSFFHPSSKSYWSSNQLR